MSVTSNDSLRPAITISPAAVAALRGASEEAGGDELHLEITPVYRYDLFFGPAADGEIAVEVAGIKVLLSRDSAGRADGLSIDYVEGPGGAGFKIQSPHEPSTVRQISPAELKNMMDVGARFELFDVRTPRERAIASLPDARLLDEEARHAIRELPRDTPLVFHCHHGGRSQAAAEHFLAAGFTNVSNVRGGIDLWSQTVDPAVPRY